MNINRVLIIAEAGVNHNGNLNTAKKMIDAALQTGVDYVKFQTFITDELIDISAPKATYQIENDGDSTQYEMLKRLELSFDDFRKLKKYCEEVGVKFLSTPDDYPSLDFLCDELQLNIIKVGSGEINNIPFLVRVGRKNRDVILSTGMSTMSEVKKAYDTLMNSGARTVSILHCTSNYPAPYESVNLKAIQTLKEEFNTTIGYSDHTLGNEVSIAAVALGAMIIEKHFTLDKTMEGPDHSASINPEELKELVTEIRNIELALSGDGIKKPHDSEIETKKVVTKGIYINCDINRGEIIEDYMLVLKRPVSEISVDKFYEVIGKRAVKSLQKGLALTFSDFE